MKENWREICFFLCLVEERKRKEKKVARVIFYPGPQILILLNRGENEKENMGNLKRQPFPSIPTESRLINDQFLPPLVPLSALVVWQLLQTTKDRFSWPFFSNCATIFSLNKIPFSLIPPNFGEEWKFGVWKE